MVPRRERPRACSLCTPQFPRSSGRRTASGLKQSSNLDERSDSHRVLSHRASQMPHRSGSRLWPQVPHTPSCRGAQLVARPVLSYSSAKAVATVKFSRRSLPRLTWRMLKMSCPQARRLVVWTGFSGRAVSLDVVGSQMSQMLHVLCSALSGIPRILIPCP